MILIKRIWHDFWVGLGQNAKIGPPLFALVFVCLLGIISAGEVITGGLLTKNPDQPRVSYLRLIDLPAQKPQPTPPQITQDANYQTLVHLAKRMEADDRLFLTKVTFDTASDHDSGEDRRSFIRYTSTADAQHSEKSFRTANGVTEITRLINVEYRTPQELIASGPQPGMLADQFIPETVTCHCSATQLADIASDLSAISQGTRHYRAIPHSEAIGPLEPGFELRTLLTSTRFAALLLLAILASGATLFTMWRQLHQTLSVERTLGAELWQLILRQQLLVGALLTAPLCLAWSLASWYEANSTSTGILDELALVLYVPLGLIHLGTGVRISYQLTRPEATMIAAGDQS